eukprot:gnl/TRDRNA2_/TRDRNA2_164156_c0_seq2.p1 gnl/TRDRNA2_/TRDRNA2_164156_c0~~gnl/TRDRNA2_/TRDRNA2_164156_c0_seq2.p1  ORF type:complete len:118 (+),score=12.83 gnl/TRDRNA2_/TRDRNA2_164156_c0_seq2:245-598(+)
MKLQISFSACGKATAASLKQAMAYRYTEPGAACGPWHSSGVALSGDTKPGSSARILFQDAYLKREKSFEVLATSAEKSFGDPLYVDAFNFFKAAYLVYRSESFDLLHCTPGQNSAVL